MAKKKPSPVQKGVRDWKHIVFYYLRAGAAGRRARRKIGTDR